jgi:hypothetical protein
VIIDVQALFGTVGQVGHGIDEELGRRKRLGIIVSLDLIHAYVA